MNDKSNTEKTAINDDDLSLKGVCWYFIQLRYKRYLFIGLAGLVASCVLYKFNQFETIKVATDFFGNLTERLIDFSIFLPSMSFVCLSLLPSVSKKVKIILSQKASEDNRVIGNSLLMNLVFIMYLAVFTLILAVSVSVLTKFPEKELETIFYCACWKPTMIILTTLLIVLPLILINELFLTIFILHSMLRRDLDEFKTDYENFFSKIKHGEVTAKQFEEAIDSKIQDTLAASKIDLLEKLKKQSEEK